MTYPAYPGLAKLHLLFPVPGIAPSPLPATPCSHLNRKRSEQACGMFQEPQGDRMASAPTSSSAQFSRAGPRGTEERKEARERGEEKKGQAGSLRSPVSLSASLGSVGILDLSQCPYP